MSLKIGGSQLVSRFDNMYELNENIELIALSCLYFFFSIPNASSLLVIHQKFKLLQSPLFLGGGILGSEVTFHL